MKDVLEKIYEQLLNTDRSLAQIIEKKYKVTDYSAPKLRQGMYDEYGKDHVLGISQDNSTKRQVRTRRENNESWHSEETKEKISQTFQKDDGLRERSRQQMNELHDKGLAGNDSEANKKAAKTRKKRYDNWHDEDTKEKISDALEGREFTSEHIKKLSEAAKRRYEREEDHPLKVLHEEGHSEEVKSKLSDICKRQWENGTHSPTFVSSGQKELFNIISDKGYEPEMDYVIESKPFDVYVPALNLVLEFNGTYWHLDPDAYDEDYYDDCRDVTASQVWDEDREKMKLAESKGYNIEVVWQREWESVEEKRSIVNSIIKGYQ